MSASACSVLAAVDAPGQQVERVNHPGAQVFDDKATFAEWFGNVLGKAAAGEIAPADEWLETEKRVVVIHRLHQILEPFMLRRQVQDVEGKLPPKVRSPVRA